MQHINFVTIPQAAKIIGLSRSRVFRQVKAGLIPAEKVGRFYLISKGYLSGFELTRDDEKKITKAVKRTIKEYGEVLRRLGKE
jgi:excisionase family DNA binding protein